MFPLIAGIAGGLGLFFAGVWLLTENLKMLTGRQVRRVIISWTRNRLMSFGWGILAAAITQSMSVLVFLLVGMATAGFIPVAAALPIIAGANVGACLLLLLAVLDIKLLMLCVIGITGTALSWGIKRVPLPLVAALFGLALIFLGLDMLQQSAIPLVEQPWAQEFLAGTRESYLLGFIAGALLTIIAQSSVAIGILVVALAGTGLFGVEQSIMIIYGSNLGSSLNTLLLSWQLRGRPMQIALFQVVLNIIGSLIMVPLFYLEIGTGIPLVKALVMALPGGIEQQMIYVYLLFNLLAAGILMLLSPQVIKLVEHYFPPTLVEDDARPHYIVNQRLQEADTALDLVELEQSRLLGFFSRYFSILRDGDDEHSSLEHLHEAFQRVAQEINACLEELGQLDHNHLVFEHLNQVLTRQRLMITVEHTLFELAWEIQNGAADQTLKAFNQRLVESLDAVMLTLHGATVDRDEHDMEILDHITGDRSELMQRIRMDFLHDEVARDNAVRLNLLKITNLCERLIWLLRGFSVMVAPPRLAHVQRSEVAIS